MQKVYASLSGALDKFLKNVVLEYVGCIPFDRKLQLAVQKRSLVTDATPDCPAAEAIETLAQKLLKTPIRSSSTGALTFL